jgi:hypothetical protein
MTPTVTDERLRAVAAQPNEPVRLIDPHTSRGYVLLSVEAYDRLVADFNPADAYAAIDRAFAEGWNDPRMDDYDRYEELRK